MLFTTSFEYCSGPDFKSNPLDKAQSQGKTQ